MTVSNYPVHDYTGNLLKTCEDMTSAMSSWVNASTQSSAAAWQGIDDMTRSLGSLIQDSCARSLSVCKTIMEAKSPAQATETQGDYLKECFDDMVACGSKWSEISLHTAKSAMEPLAQHAHQSMETLMKKATKAA